MRRLMKVTNEIAVLGLVPVAKPRFRSPDRHIMLSVVELSVVEVNVYPVWLSLLSGTLEMMNLQLHWTGPT